MLGFKLTEEITELFEYFARLFFASFFLASRDIIA